MRIRLRMGHHLKANWFVSSSHVSRRVDVNADEVQRTRDDLEIFRGKLGRVTAGGGEISVGVFSFLNYCHVGRVQFPGGPPSCLDVRGGLDHWNTNCHVFSQANLRIILTLRANRLDGESVPEYGVMPRLVEAIGRQLHARCMSAGSVTQLDKGTKLVNREEVLHPI